MKWKELTIRTTLGSLQGPGGAAVTLAQAVSRHNPVAFPRTPSSTFPTFEYSSKIFLESLNPNHNMFTRSLVCSPLPRKSASDIEERPVTKRHVRSSIAMDSSSVY